MKMVLLIYFIKGTNKEYKNLNAFEDCGDIGDEYIFRAPEKDLVVNTLGNKASINVLKDNELEKSNRG